MSRSTIAIDMDDVIVDHYEEVVKFHNERYGTAHTLTDYTTDHWSQVWGTNHEETERRAREFASIGVHGRKIKPGAIPAIRTLHGSYDLVIVTVRRKVNVKPTTEWLAKYFPDIFKEVHFLPIWEEDTKQTKADICRELGADYLIDDSLKHCTIAAESGLPVLLFGNYPWNQSKKLPANMQRVRGWKAVLEYFNAQG